MGEEVNELEAQGRASISNLQASLAPLIAGLKPSNRCQNHCLEKLIMRRKTVEQGRGAGKELPRMLAGRFDRTDSGAVKSGAVGSSHGR
ncbi:MAG: hypothetical protein C5B50_17740 [Verrucomicrobia bacterium]|nr:MAG: hypothetical protein C5B50_17740 [Verrucomicrobiota bacterium]